MSGRDHPGRALIPAIGGLISKAHTTSATSTNTYNTIDTKQRAGIIVKTFRSLAPLICMVYELWGYWPCSTPFYKIYRKHPPHKTNLKRTIKHSQEPMSRNMQLQYIFVTAFS